MIELFIISFCLQIAGILFLLTRSFKLENAFRVAHILFTAGLAFGLTASLKGLTGSLQPDTVLHPYIIIDSLSLFFLFVIQVAAIPTILYSMAYSDRLSKSGQPVHSLTLFILLCVLFTQCVVIANHAILFLVVWEMMAVTSYLGMVYDKEKKEVQSGSFIYLIMTHLSVMLLYVFFIFLHEQTGSWLFTEMKLHGFSWTVFIIGFSGFAIKAGWMPVHFWLPRAHPIAPTMLSAFLSGVIIKMGIYGIIRMLMITPVTYELAGWVVLALSLFTAIFGVWYALAQHDIKTLLAYHSVENIGIIGLGIGLGMLGMTYQQPVMILLGFGGALLHTLNHAVFKSLLFIGSGVIYENLHTRNIESMGGLVHHAPAFVTLFLIGSVAICGLPPLNGFISEFILYLGFFESAGEMKSFYPLLMLIMTVGLAFIGGLAVACFTKVNSVMFQGSPRTEMPEFRVSRLSLAAMIWLAVLCVWIGLYPQSFLSLLTPAVAGFGVPGEVSLTAFDSIWVFNGIFTGLFVVIAAVIWIKLRWVNIRGQRVTKVWACGYRRLSARMQYTASSYADELNSLAERFLHIKKNINPPDEIFPSDGHFSSHADDYSERKIARPAYHFVYSLFRFSDIINKTDIRYYIAFILAAIIFYSFLAFIWTL